MPDLECFFHADDGKKFRHANSDIAEFNIKYRKAIEFPLSMWFLFFDENFMRHVLIELCTLHALQRPGWQI